MFIFYSKALVKRQTRRFRCTDKTLINASLRCNGIHDCADGSDETETVCQFDSCLPNELQCDYGACVKDLSICGTKPDTTGRCRIAHVPANGYISLEADHSTRLEENDFVSNFVPIRFGCQRNYYLIDDEPSNFCLNGKWVKNVWPDCHLRCSMRDIASYTYLPQCSRSLSDGTSENVRCGLTDFVEPGVNVRVTCRIGYKPSIAYEELVKCQPNGEWNRKPNPCTQICGEEGADGSTYVVRGQVTNNTQVPWHVGIYYIDEKEKEPIYTCGGTILNPRLVVSAAHCFWDDEEHTLHAATNYRVTAGKFYRQYFDSREINKFQILLVTDIKYPKGYNHYDGLYANDVAVLILDKFIEFKPHVAPACINYNYGYEERVISPGKLGRVAGWGYTESGGELSDELKMIELPVIDREQCKDALEQTFRRFLTDEKYCAGAFGLNVGVCQGDSGGGLLFPIRENGKKVYYLRGIVSSGQNKGGSCDTDTYSLFTNTAHFTPLLKFYDEATKPEYSDASDSSCHISSVPINGYAEYENKQGSRISLNDSVPHKGTIVYRCSEGFRLVGDSTNECMSGQWKTRVPYCIAKGKYTNQW